MTTNTENPYQSPAFHVPRQRTGLIIVLLLTGAAVLVGAILWRATLIAQRAEQEALKAREIARAMAEQAERARQESEDREASSNEHE